MKKSELFSVGTFPLVVTTVQGLEEVLAEELRGLGAKDVSKGKRAVYFDADRELLYRVNMCSRLSIKVLRPLFNFTAKNDTQLYQGINRFNWAEILTRETTFAIDKVVHSEFFTHSQYAALKTKDAIVDRMRKELGSRPNVDVYEPDFSFHLRITGDQVYISLNASGKPLFKRGYREERGVAPLNEVLAAGMIKLSGWDGTTPFKDPMCGSGTIAIEAGLISKNRFPGLVRRKFAFQQWPDFDKKLQTKLMEELADLERPIEAKITCSDMDPDILKACKNNMRGAGLSLYDVDVKEQDFFNSSERNPVTMIMNPPYGERMPLENVEDLYSGIGNVLKRKYPGSSAWILSSSFDGMKMVGLKPSAKYELMNGSLPCKYQKFESYEGSKKASKNKNRGPRNSPISKI